MPTGKRQIIVKKLGRLFKTQEWQDTPQTNQSLPVARAEKPETTLSVLNSGVPLTIDITAQGNNERIPADVSPTEENLDEARTLNSPLLRSPLSPISAFGQVHCNTLNGDMERTRKRYQTAVLRLKQALELRPENWDGLDADGFSDITENDDTLTLRQAIENRLNHASNSNNTMWSKGRKLFEQVFVVFFPLTRNILVVAKEAQAVCPQLSSYLVSNFCF